MSRFDKRRRGFAIAIAVLSLTCAVCSRQNDQAASARAAANVNIAAADMGGRVELVSYMYGPGFLGRRLIDGLNNPTWQVNATLPEQAMFPHEIIISFFDRQPATVGSVVIVLGEDVHAAPKDVEIWTSPHDLENGYTRVATKTLEAKVGEQAITFPDVEAKFVKLRITSGYWDTIDMAEVRVIESTRRGYIPLFTRAPMVQRWKGSPHEAAQRGLDWLQQSAVEWARDAKCFGCHVHSQVLMGQAVALKQGYHVNMPAVTKLTEYVRETQTNGIWSNPPHSATAFGAMGSAYSADLLNINTDDLLQNSSDRLVENQLADGAMPVDQPEPPIIQGQFMTTGNALVALERAAANFKEPRYQEAATRALSWIATHEPQTTQDKIFKILSLVHYGTPDQKRIAWSVVETLAAEQMSDGGWKEHAKQTGSNAIATGQVLYAFKHSGISIHGEMFRRGVEFLLKYQENDPVIENGSWKVINTDSHRPTSFAQTMWAVIALAGSYGTEPTGALKIVRQQGDKPPTRNLLIVLDVSGSMNTKLDETTRWQTALGVLQKVVDELPEDMNVGLRVYGHRFSSKSPETCTDSELVVPIAKLDRKRILATASKLRPRGETPLIHSTLQTLSDLKGAVGGSVVLITDGEESCKGDTNAAAAAIKASGLNVTLNIVGFTITGQATQTQLSTLAGSTGGRYLSAQDGAQLSRAVMLAALQRLPYDILDKSGKVLVSGQTSELSRELQPGAYRLRIDAFGQVLEEPITIEPDKTTSLALGVEGDRLVIRR